MKKHILITLLSIVALQTNVSHAISVTKAVQKAREQADALIEKAKKQVEKAMNKAQEIQKQIVAEMLNRQTQVSPQDINIVSEKINTVSEVLGDEHPEVVKAEELLEEVIVPKQPIETVTEVIVPEQPIETVKEVVVAEQPIETVKEVVVPEQPIKTVTEELKPVTTTIATTTQEDRPEETFFNEIYNSINSQSFRSTDNFTAQSFNEQKTSLMKDLDKLINTLEPYASANKQEFAQLDRKKVIIQLDYITKIIPIFVSNVDSATYAKKVNEINKYNKRILSKLNATKKSLTNKFTTQPVRFIGKTLGYIEDEVKEINEQAIEVATEELQPVATTTIAVTERQAGTFNKIYNSINPQSFRSTDNFAAQSFNEQKTSLMKDLDKLINKMTIPYPSGRDKFNQKIYPIREEIVIQLDYITKILPIFVSNADSATYAEEVNNINGYNKKILYKLKSTTKSGLYKFWIAPVRYIGNTLGYIKDEVKKINEQPIEIATEVVVPEQPIKTVTEELQPVTTTIAVTRKQAETFNEIYNSINPQSFRSTDNFTAQNFNEQKTSLMKDLDKLINMMDIPYASSKDKFDKIYQTREEVVIRLDYITKILPIFVGNTDSATYAEEVNKINGYNEEILSSLESTKKSNLNKFWIAPVRFIGNTLGYIKDEVEKMN